MEIQVSESGSPAVQRFHCAHCGQNLIGIAVGNPCPACDSLFLVNNPANERCGKAVASLTLGILSVLSAVAIGLGIVLGLFALIYARKARKQAEKGLAPLLSFNIARTGKILGWIGIILNLLMIAFIAWILYQFSVMY